jgi:hypothetical protein
LKKLLRISSILIGIFALIAIVWIALILFFFTGVHPYTPDPIYSPDESTVIIPMINFDKANYATYLLVHLKIQDTRTGDILYQVQTGASDRMRWSVFWLNNNTFQLESSDIGFYCWKEEVGTWMETECPEAPVITVTPQSTFVSMPLDTPIVTPTRARPAVSTLSSLRRFPFLLDGTMYWTGYLISPDGKWLIQDDFISGDSPEMTILSLEDPKQDFTIQLGQSDTNFWRFSNWLPDSSAFIQASGNEFGKCTETHLFIYQLYLQDVATFEIQGDGDRLDPILSPDGQKLAVRASVDKKIYILDKDARPIRSISFPLDRLLNETLGPMYWAEWGLYLETCAYPIRRPPSCKLYLIDPETYTVSLVYQPETWFRIFGSIVENKQLLVEELIPETSADVSDRQYQLKVLDSTSWQALAKLSFRGEVFDARDTGIAYTGLLIHGYSERFIYFFDWHSKSLIYCCMAVSLVSWDKNTKSFLIVTEDSPENLWLKSISP